MVTSIATVLLGVIMALLKSSYERERNEITRQLNEVRAEAADAKKSAKEAGEQFGHLTRDYLERLHGQELEVVRLRGEVNLVKQNDETRTKDVEEIRENMVTRDTFEARTAGIIDLLKRIEGGGGRSRGSESSMPAVRPPRPGERG